MQVKPIGDGQGKVSTTEGADGAELFRFTQPISYSGRNFGAVQVHMQKAELINAASHMRNMLIGLGVLVVAMVGCLSYVAARTLLWPLRRLKGALRDAAAGDVDFQISHQRKDEFGELYDRFNAFAVSVQSRGEPASGACAGSTETVILDEQSADQTVVTPAKLTMVSR